MWCEQSKAFDRVMAMGGRGQGSSFHFLTPGSEGLTCHLNLSVCLLKRDLEFSSELEWSRSSAPTRPSLVTKHDRIGPKTVIYIVDASNLSPARTAWAFVHTTA